MPWGEDPERTEPIRNVRRVCPLPGGPPPSALTSLAGLLDYGRGRWGGGELPG